MIKRFYIRNRKYILGSLFVIVFLISLINNIPTWILGSAINKYSEGRLSLYDQQGTFWHGSGLLVASEPKLQQSAPLLLIDWHIRMGFSKFVDIKFTIGNTQIADIYLNKTGLNLDKLNLSLSISQVSQLSSIVKDLSLSGNINIATDHLSLGKKTNGLFHLTLSNVSSSLSPVNPLGTYKVEFNASSGAIEVSSSGGSALILNGTGNVNGLSLSAKIDESKKEQLIQFITIMGAPKANGSYELKIF